MVVTIVLKLRAPDEKNWRDGSADTGVCRIDLVVGEMVCRSDGSGPVTVG